MPTRLILDIIQDDRLKMTILFEPDSIGVASVLAKTSPGPAPRAKSSSFDEIHVLQVTDFGHVV